MNEDKKFNKWCYICEKRFKIHFTDEEKRTIIQHYGSIRDYPRNNSMCLVCNLRIQALILRAPCKCKKCSSYFWMYKTHPKYPQAKEAFLEKKKIWFDYCPECDTIYQKSLGLQHKSPKPKEMLKEKDKIFLPTLHWIEKIRS